MACSRYSKLFQRYNPRLQSIGIRNTWIIVKNNSGYDLRADICFPDKNTNSRGMDISFTYHILTALQYTYIYKS